MALPAVVPKAVIIAGIPVKINQKPILIGGIPLLFLHIAERPEAAPNVVENAVQYNPDTVFMQDFANGGEILVSAKAAVDFPVIPGVISVPVGFKNRGKVNGVTAELTDMLGPVTELFDAVDGDTVIFPRRAAETDRIYLIKYTVIRPHKYLLYPAGEFP